MARAALSEIKEAHVSAWAFLRGHNAVAAMLETLDGSSIARRGKSAVDDVLSWQTALYGSTRLETAGGRLDVVEDTHVGVLRVRAVGSQEIAAEPNGAGNMTRRYSERADTTL